MLEEEAEEEEEDTSIRTWLLSGEMDFKIFTRLKCNNFLSR